MLAYLKTKKKLEGITFEKNDALLFNDCLRIANRLRGVSDNKYQSLKSETTKEEFMKKEFNNLTLEKLEIDIPVVEILKERLVEIQKNLATKSSLSVVILCGSVLEGLLLGMAIKNMKDFNQSAISPKNKEKDKVKPFQEWTLSDFIDVAYNIGYIGLNVKNFSHSLRYFRNYIHPYQQLNSGFSPDIDTAKISWQVLQAAISDLIKRKNTKT